MNQTQVTFDFDLYKASAEYRMSLTHQPIGNRAYELTDFRGYSVFDKNACPIVRDNGNGSYTWIR